MKKKGSIRKTNVDAARGWSMRCSDAVKGKKESLYPLMKWLHRSFGWSFSFSSCLLLISYRLSPHFPLVLSPHFPFFPSLPIFLIFSAHLAVKAMKNTSKDNATVSSFCSLCPCVHVSICECLMTGVFCCFCWPNVLLESLWIVKERMKERKPHTHNDHTILLSIIFEGEEEKRRKREDLEMPQQKEHNVTTYTSARERFETSNKSLNCMRG